MTVIESFFKCDHKEKRSFLTVRNFSRFSMATLEYCRMKVANNFPKFSSSTKFWKKKKKKREKTLNCLRWQSGKLQYFLGISPQDLSNLWPKIMTNLILFRLESQWGKIKTAYFLGKNGSKSHWISEILTIYSTKMIIL